MEGRKLYWVNCGKKVKKRVKQLGEKGLKAGVVKVTIFRHLLLYCGLDPELM